MRIITREEKAKYVAERWGKNYFHDFVWGNTISGNAVNIYNELIALGGTPNPDDIDKVIGNKSWTRLTCNECGKNCESVIEIGEPEDYDSMTVVICKECLNKAVKFYT